MSFYSVHFYSTASKTVAFWDMDDCPIPDGLDALAFRKNINTALWKQGFEGGVDITAFGDFCKTETSKDFSPSESRSFTVPRWRREKPDVPRF
ncbi:hypothetical protein F2Q69_00014388 [Brassica cretica]|uniref:NYN domain-containing protein n=1 Tax=Brassica cretica TaxID=69181 RepID=A0A8S9R3F5_BRACR|nr:hypothetical protein F2Q69_00014388 [Brassica cretica]